MILYDGYATERRIIRQPTTIHFARSGTFNPTGSSVIAALTIYQYGFYNNATLSVRKTETHKN